MEIYLLDKLFKIYLMEKDMKFLQLVIFTLDNMKWVKNVD